MTRNSQTTSPRRPGRTVTVGMVLSGVGVVAVCLVGRHYLMSESASAQAVRRSAQPSAGPVATAPNSERRPAEMVRTAAEPSRPAASRSTAQLKVVAVVNGEEISRNELANECLRYYGKEVLEEVVSTYVTMQECQRQNIAVSQAEVNAEIKRLAEHFSVPVEHWLKTLGEERGISPKQYSELIWQILALRKLAGARMEVTQEELVAQYERQYGEGVKARLIVCEDQNKAEKVRAAAAANPERFGELAKDESVDAPSASLNGLIQPIRRHAGPKEIEQAAFQMRDGDISPVIPVAGQFVILKREGLQPAVRVDFERVKMQMIEGIRDEKSRRVAQEILGELLDRAQLENVMNDPAKSRQMPGVAAVVNGYKISVRELAEVCLERHGEDVLRGTIHRRLLEQACKKRGMTVGEADLDGEIARAAARELPLKPDGSPDVEKWTAIIAERQNIPLDLYRRDTVWPSVALKKLVGEKVEVSDEDLERGYEANYGPRVRCLAIVLDDLRRAQDVWSKARGNPTKEYFGELAAQYSVDPRSQALKGEWPPIHKHGGMPELEKEAFSLEAGELSSIIQVGPSRYVILFCEGLTKPVHVDVATVRDLIYEEIHEKKLRIAMAGEFEALKKSATIDNYLEGTVQSPTKLGRRGEAGRGPTLRPSTSKP